MCITRGGLAEACTVCELFFFVVVVVAVRKQECTLFYVILSLHKGQSSCSAPLRGIMSSVTWGRVFLLLRSCPLINIANSESSCVTPSPSNTSHFLQVELWSHITSQWKFGLPSFLFVA